MITDNELRKLIPELLRRFPTGSPNSGARYTREELNDHALATARAVWAAAIEEAAKVCERHQTKAPKAVNYTRDAYIATLQCAAAIRDLIGKL